MNKETVIIIGAGVSGLVLATELAADYKVILLEAQTVAGGRIFSYTDDSFNTVIEGGAEFLHGSTKHTKAILDEAGITYEKTGGKMYRKTATELKEQTEMIKGWDELLDKMKGLDEDMTLQQFLETYYNHEGDEALRERVIAYASGFDCADVHTASTKALYEEWSSEGDQYRVKGGYGMMTGYLLQKCIEKGCEIHYSTTVKNIEWLKGNVTLRTAGNVVYTGNKCIITLPIGVLQNPNGASAVDISTLPGAYKHAIMNIGYGGVLKVIMQFSKPFWKDDAGFIMSDQLFPTWWTQLPSTEPLLTAWAGGSFAKRLKANTDVQLLEIALAAAAHVFDTPLAEIKNSLQTYKVFNWYNVPQALGCYSFATLHTAEALEQLRHPIEDTVYFTGESLYSGPYPGTVEAAITVALGMAKQLKK